MLHEITTLKDVETFIEQIAEEIDDFHPLTDFKDYVYPDSYFRRYTDQDAEIRNKQLDRCFDVCTKITPNYFTYISRLYEQKHDGKNLKPISVNLPHASANKRKQSKGIQLLW